MTDDLSCAPTSLPARRLQQRANIMMIPNEDGLGPSTALLYVARGLATVAESRDFCLKFIVRNKAKEGFNISSYMNLGEHIGVQTQGEDSVIHLKKDGERVRPMGTAEGLLDYPWKAEEYGRSLERYIKNDKFLRCVICMGTPVGHVNSKSEKLPLPVIEVFDHSWPLSLEYIFEGGRTQHPDDWRTRRVEDVDISKERFNEDHWPRTWAGRTVDDIVHSEVLPMLHRHDKQVDKVFLFPEPLGPGEFWCKWQSLVPGNVVRIPGVMGGWPDGKGGGERESVRKEARDQLARKLALPVKDMKKAKIVLVQGGGTPVWDRFLVRMVGQCLDFQDNLKNTIFLFTRAGVAAAFDSPHVDRSTVTYRKWATFADLEKAVKKSKTARLVSGDKDADFADFQKFYLVADLVFSRPGGITVQDAIACRTPLVCAAEPGHWQTEKIRRHCLLHKVMRDVPFEAFQAGGVGLVLDQFGFKEENEEMINVMRTIPNRQEHQLAERIFEMMEEVVPAKSGPSLTR